MCVIWGASNYADFDFPELALHGIRAAETSFDFARNILDRIQRVVLFPVGRGSDELSPLTPLSRTSSEGDPVANSNESENAMAIILENGSFQEPRLARSQLVVIPSGVENEILPRSRSSLTSSLSNEAPDNSLSRPSGRTESSEEDYIGLIERRPSLASESLPAAVPMPSNTPSPPELTPLDSSDAVARPPSARKLKRRAREKALSKRNAKRKKEMQTDHPTKPKLSQKQIRSARAVKTTFSSLKMPISSGGYIGQRSTKKTKATFDLDHFIGPNSKLNFTLRKWAGKSPSPLIDNEDRVIGVCAGIPKNAKDWDALQRHAASLLENARGKLKFDQKDKDNRRGKFSAINIGISHGGGQPYPKALEQDAANAQVLEELMEDESFKRISGFAAGAFSTWAPRLHKYENDCLSEIIENDNKLRRENRHPSPNGEPLRRNWPNSPWASAALNFGPQTVCCRHADYGNLAFGWCCITALGDFDYTKGGHLILWDLKLVVEFPPGSTILIPSSAIHHSNTRIQSGEHRYSFTQYSSGGLFRWRDNDFQTVENHRGSLTTEETASLLTKLSSQLSFGLSLYSTVQELEGQHGVEISVS
ncbi:hypothetical protein CVT26_009203 [Gymnopilus dilepis]|uniref:Uncharacterized protein n=1 Tax=Gymnopilus dilepis TaxID=231916 RepID=A0A409WUK6_9AGAR|nr:hypothetical protein CVT26_009203 [Gymnopilus dilepis]